MTGRRNGVLVRLLLALALLAGLLGMHALAPPARLPAMAHGMEHSAPPPGEHGHPGPVCESGAPVSPLWTESVDAAGVIVAEVPASPRSRVVATVARGGCDPPVRAQLQVWRT